LALQALQLAGQTFWLDFEGFHRPLGILQGAHTLSLAPWTYRRHMDTLRTATSAHTQGLHLDAQALAAAVLAGLNPEAQPPAETDAGTDLTPIALWWSAGGDAPLLPPPAPHGWLELGQVRAQLQPWSERARLQALDACLQQDAEGQWFDPVDYLDRMVRATLIRLDAPVALDDLDARATALLLHACVALNTLDETDAALLDGPLAREHAARILRLCQALGWPPSQIWALPAPEVARLEKLLQLTQPAPQAPRPATAQGLAAHPDAVVFEFE
jgi:hypothetical protein